MQFLVEFLPLLLFLGTYLAYDDLYAALKVLMVAMPISFAIKWWMTKTIDKILLGSTIALLLFGTATLLLCNPLFLYWKPTAFYWVTAAVFFGSMYIGDRPIVQRMFAGVGQMPTRQWRQLNLSWVVFFVASGFLNLFVAYNFSESFWVKFKVFGFTALTLVFIFAQMFWLMRHLEPAGENAEEGE